MSTIAAYNSDTELERELARHHIDPSAFGKGKAKTLPDLREELARGECRLQSHPSPSGVDGPPELVREVHIVRIRLKYRDHILVHESQTLPDGRTRPKNTLVAEKMLEDEAREAAVSRALKEELGLESGTFEMDSNSWLTVMESNESPSYPGLRSEYHISAVEVNLDVAQAAEQGLLSALGIRDGGIERPDFDTNEDKGNGKIIVNHWRWVLAPQANAHLNLPTVTMDMSILDQDPQLHAARDVVEMMITQHYKPDFKSGRRVRLDCKQLTGGFSGSILVLVKSFDKDGKELHPEILKFDDKEALDEEFACYERIRGVVPKFVPDQTKIALKVLTNRELRLPSKDRRLVKSFLVGVVMEMVGACWQVPGIPVDQEPVTDMKELFLVETLASVHPEKISDRFRGFGSVESIIRATFGRSGPFDTLLRASRQPAGEAPATEIHEAWRRGTIEGKGLHDLWFLRLENRLESKRVVKIFPEEGPPVHAEFPNEDLLRLQARLKGLMDEFRSILSEGTPWGRGHEPMFCMVHGDLNAANIMVDLHANPWLIDFADVKMDLPMSDIGKLCNVIILEYTVFPISREEATNLPAEALAAQLRCVKALEAVKELKTHLANPEVSISDAVSRAFKTFQNGKFAEFFDSIHGRLTEDLAEPELVLEDGKQLVNAMVAALASFTVPKDLSANLQTPQMKHAAGIVTTILQRACDRLQACKFPLEDQHPGSILNLMLDEALKGLSYSGLTSHQLDLRLHFVEILVENLTRVLRVLPRDWTLPSEEQRMVAMLDSDYIFDPISLDKHFENYRSFAQHEHGTTTNPVTGQVLDIMTQCVSLNFEGDSVRSPETQEYTSTVGLEEKEEAQTVEEQEQRGAAGKNLAARLAEHAVYEELLEEFFPSQETLPLQLKVWVEGTAGKIIGVEQDLYDVRVQVLQPGWEGVLRTKVTEFTGGKNYFEQLELEKFIFAFGIVEEKASKEHARLLKANADEKTATGTLKTEVLADLDARQLTTDQLLQYYATRDPALVISDLYSLGIPEGEFLELRRGIKRANIRTRAMLLLGDPAAGKTTCSKQVVSDVMRGNRSQRFVPAMIRIIDLDGAFEEIKELEQKLERKLDLVTAYLMLRSSELQFELFMGAQRDLRLLIILDGMVGYFL